MFWVKLLFDFDLINILLLNSSFEDNKIKLHYDYDYQPYNYAHNNHAANSLTLLSSNEEFNNNLLIKSKSNNNLTQNINIQN